MRAPWQRNHTHTLVVIENSPEKKGFNKLLPARRCFDDDDDSSSGIAAAGSLHPKGLDSFLQTDECTRVQSASWAFFLSLSLLVARSLTKLAMNSGCATLVAFPSIRYFWFPTG